MPALDQFPIAPKASIKIEIKNLTDRRHRTDATEIPFAHGDSPKRLKDRQDRYATNGIKISNKV